MALRRTHFRIASVTHQPVFFSLCNDGRFRSAPLIRQGSVHNQQDYFVDSEALRRQVRQTTECWFDWLYRP